MKRIKMKLSLLLWIHLLVIGWALPAAASSISLDKNVVAPGARIVVTLELTEELPNNGWVGIFKSSSPHGTATQNDANDLTYQYVKTKRRFVFNVPKAEGRYDFRVNNPKTNKEIATKAFTVAVDEASASIRLSKTTFAPGETIKVTIKASSSYPNHSWVGIVPSNVAHGSTKTNDSKDLTYQYLMGRTDTTLSFTAPKAEGKYDFRMNETTNDKEVAHRAFTVAVDKAAASIKLTKTTFAPGETIKATIKASSSYPNHSWVGIVPSNVAHGSTKTNDSKDLTYQYLMGRTATTLSFTAPKAEGKYDFRMNETTNDKEVTHTTFTVSSSTAKQATTSATAATAPTPKKENLIIDDNVDVSALIRELTAIVKN